VDVDVSGGRDQEPDPGEEPQREHVRRGSGHSAARGCPGSVPWPPAICPAHHSGNGHSVLGLRVHQAGDERHPLITSSSKKGRKERDAVLVVVGLWRVAAGGHY